MSEETTKYQKEWKEFQNKQASGCIVLLLAAPFAALAWFLSDAYRAYAHIFDKILIVSIVIPFGYFIWGAWKDKRPKCPRCKANFDHYKPMAVKFCVNCGLPKFYGSSHFYELWGPDEGRDLAERVERGEL